MTILRSTLFFLWFATVSVVLSLAYLPVLLLPSRAIRRGAKLWAGISLWGLKTFALLDYEVRGPIPPGGALVASKHMSMWDTLALFLLIGDATIVLKRQLLNIPFYGWYLGKSGQIAIDREGGASALRRMATAAHDAMKRGQTVMIFPEGTRKKPGATPDYKPGVAALYDQLAVPCYPVALNSGLFWTGPAGFLKKRGKIVIAFLPPIPPGLKRREFMATLQERIETATAELLIEGRKQLA
jgi:1-acyl-sn-glycerol-3-phosphate acyltransferase